MAAKHTPKHEARPLRVKRNEFRLDSNDFVFILLTFSEAYGVTSYGSGWC